MARKIEQLNQLYEDTAKRLTKPSEWRAFLSSACRNYRLRFDEQLLVFAQRPYATAVLEIERWNSRFGRWVNRGASGIAVFEDAERNNQRLKYYFDISDTHESRLSRPVPIWNMREEYAEDVIDTLESTFGELDDRSTLSKAIQSASHNAVEDNTPDYVGDLLLSADNSFLYGLSEDAIRNMYNHLVTQSVAYIMMERLGLDTSMYFSDDDFKIIMNFSSVDVMNTLGFATSDISEMALSEIAKTITALDRENRTFASPQRSGYNDNTIQPERRNEHDRDNLHQTGRLQSARPDLARSAAGGVGNVRAASTEISEGTSPRSVLQSPDQVQADTASSRHRADSGEDGEQHHPSDGAAAGSDGAAKGSESAPVGGYDEQHPSVGTGNRDERSDLHSITPNEQARSNDEPAFSDLSARELAEKMYDYLTDYIVDYYEEQDGVPIEVPEDGVDPELLQRLEHDLYDVDTMDQMLSFFSESYYRRDNNDEINAVYDKVIDALQHRINDPIMSDDKYVRGDTRLDIFDEDAERMKYPFFGVDEVVNEIFATTPYLGASLEEIRAYIEGVSDPQRRMEYTRSIFNNDFSELILADETRVGYKTYENGLLIWKGRYPSRESQRFLRWDAVAGHFDAMRKLGMLRSDIKSLLSRDGQLLYLADAAGANAPVFVFSQEIIDNVLTRGSNVVQSKMRIYEQFQKSLSRDENIRFLKREYGIGGGSSAVAYTGISEMHDGKGITLSFGFDPDRPHQLLKWNYVEKRIRELISLDRYLNDKEKDSYPIWLEKQEGYREDAERAKQRREEERRRQMEMETSPEERLLNEGVQHTYEYQYHLGDTVYIGASTYELLSIDDDRVMLFDPKFPLINTEMPRTEFDAKVQENPLNNHLRILVEQTGEPKEAAQSEENRSFSDKLWDDYRQAQDANPNRIVLYRVGDFMEIMGDDVPKIALELDITPTQRVLSDGRRIPMCGFPRNHTQALSDMLMDRGHDLVLCTDENGEFKTIRLNSDSKGEPRQSRVIARVEYLDHDGNVYDNQEYTSEYHFKMDIQEESDFTDGLKVYLYADKDGNVGEYPFLNIPVIKSIEIVDFAPFANEHDMMIDRAKELINEFCQREYHHSADFDDLSNVSLAYTETEDGMHEIQSYADLESFRIVTTVDGQNVRMEDFESLQDMVNQGLQGLEFGDLVYVSEDELAPFYEPDEDIANVVHTAYSEPPTDDIEDDELSEVDPDKIRASLAESGIVNGEVVDPDKLNANPFIQQVMADFEAATQAQPEEEIKLRSVVIDLRPDNVIVADYIGRTIRIDDREFRIEDVSDRGEVSLRDLTFERDNGYPIFRNEKAAFVRRILAEQSKQNQQEQHDNEIIPIWERQSKTKAQTFDLHPDIPISDRHTFDLKSFTVEEVGKKARFRRNVEAIQVLKECQFDNRFATPDEQQLLAQYVGWGGIPEAFDENNAAWADEFTELYGLLSPEEYTSARASTLTAFYTPPVVISAMYKVMENMGFQRGNILEPSCGIGNFIGMLPDSMSESRVFGVEIDTISAAIAQQLYQRSSIAALPFEKAEIPDSFFDAVVGNVPFGDDRISDKRYDKHHFLIHDYFFAKSLDKLRPGGVMALVTSRGTMDKENPAVRKYIAQRADLLGAIRLPNNTFRGNAGTDVVSDILILQKRDRIIDIEPSWVHLNTDDNGITMNSYYIEHPEMILGEMKMVSGRFGMTPDCLPYEGSDLGELLNEAVSNIHGEVTEYEIDEDMEEDLSIPADPSVRNFSFTLVDGQIYFRENSRMIPFDVSATAQNRIKGMIPIRDSVRRLLEMQTENYPDSAIQAEQERLNTLYDNYTKKYGLINSRANNSAFSMDSSYSLISSLEILDEDGNLERKADIFTKRTIRAHEPVTSVDTASEALAVSMAERACVDMDFMSKLSGLSEEKLYEELKGVIFLNPMHGYGNSYEAKYMTSDEYLSGNVREKLKWARRSAEVNPNDYSVNVEALERVQPEDLKASEISVRLGATWLPVEDVQKFIYQLLDTPHYARWRIKVHYSPITGEWNIENKTYDRTNVKAYSTYGTDRINAYQIIEQTLNLKDARIYDYIEEPDGRKKAVLNKKETAIALAKQDQIKQQFQEWIWSDPSRRERLCRLYNDKFNNIRPREYDGSHITFVGMNPEIELREHQRNAVAHIIYGGNTLLAHEVGAGKTFAMTAAAMECKRLGLCNKSLFVVPNHLTEQWAAEFLQLYPAANILVATKKDFERKNRRRFCGRIATGDYDAVIIGHSQFEKIPISIERQIATLHAQLNEITDAIYELSQKREDKFTVKQLEKTRKSIKNKLEKLNSQDRKDDVVTFEELGVDRLFVDESHYYKNRAKRCV